MNRYMFWKNDADNSLGKAIYKVLCPPSVRKMDHGTERYAAMVKQFYKMVDMLAATDRFYVNQTQAQFLRYVYQPGPCNAHAVRHYDWQFLKHRDGTISVFERAAYKGKLVLKADGKVYRFQDEPGKSGPSSRLDDFLRLATGLTPDQVDCVRYMNCWVLRFLSPVMGYEKLGLRDKVPPEFVDVYRSLLEGGIHKHLLLTGN